MKYLLIILTLLFVVSGCATMNLEDKSWSGCDLVLGNRLDETVIYKVEWLDHAIKKYHGHQPVLFHHWFLKNEG